MNNEAADLAKKLASIQARLRRDLFEVLRGHKEDLDGIFDPYSFSPLVHELRDKYLTRLYLLQGIIQQLAHFSRGRQKHATRVVSVVAENQDKLVDLVNRKLVRLNGSKVLDVKFIPGSDQGDWSALITYEANPFLEEAGETAAWM
ncbi:MAG: hypothetical protein KAX44_04535 [Candidatus Brocadiae bacterium]|nr:hypothetical protein [Candidatus Brocadiia bacterium]